MKATEDSKDYWMRRALKAEGELKVAREAFIAVCKQQATEQRPGKRPRLVEPAPTMIERDGLGMEGGYGA